MANNDALPLKAAQRKSVFAASREYVTVQGLKGLKCAVVCYFQGRIFSPTNLLSQVVPAIELMMQMRGI